MIAWDCSLITRRCWLLNLSRITSSWRASSWSLQSLCLWRVDVRKFVQPADPNGFVFFDLRQNWISIAPFSNHNHVWSSNQRVWNDHAFVVFLSSSSATSFPLICSPSVELSSVSFCKGSAWEEPFVEAKNYLVFEHAFVMVPSFFEINLHCHARVCMSHVHQSLAKAWNALGTISGEKATILNLLSKYPELDETLL